MIPQPSPLLSLNSDTKNFKRFLYEYFIINTLIIKTGNSKFYKIFFLQWRFSDNLYTKTSMNIYKSSQWFSIY